MRSLSRCRVIVALGSAGLLCGVTVLATAASALPAKGVKGDPQPELKPFTVGSSYSSGGSAATESNGDVVAAYDVTGGKTRVCVLARGKTACTHTVTLSPFAGDQATGAPFVFAPAPGRVLVLQGADGGDSSDVDDVLFTSTDGGVTFPTMERVGSLSVSAAAKVGGDIVFGSSGHDGAQVESISMDATGPSSVATLTSDAATSIGIGSYHGGALVASENVDGVTSVRYAPEGQAFDDTSSYGAASSFSQQDFEGMSGDVLLTEQETGKYNIDIRVFNGTGFGAAHVVPGDEAFGGPVGYSIEQDASGVTHVFNVLARKGYDLFEQSTTTGTHWTSPVNLGSAINNASDNPGLDANGTGIVLGVGPQVTGAKAVAYPVLATQDVTFALKKSSITKGHKTTGKGAVVAAAKSRKVELEIERHGLWYNVASTKESRSGKFSFIVHGSSLGRSHYRAVASDRAGYDQFGYSTSRALTVKK